MDKLGILEHFNSVEKTSERNGYTFSIGRILTIALLGSLCGLDNVKKIHQWASKERISEFLKEHFGIFTIPSYSTILDILAIVNPESLPQKLMEWATSLLPNRIENLTLVFDGKTICSTVFDGKTICSTGKMKEYDKPLHILSAYFAELGLTVANKVVGEETNEIPVMRDLLKLIRIDGCMITADALHCQAETAQTIIDGGGDCLLNAKNNQETLKQDIEDFVQDDELRVGMSAATTREKNGGRIEFRRAFVSNDVTWMEELTEIWPGLSCFGAINRRFTIDDKTSDEWHYYISSRNLTPEELLQFARNEWGIEAMHHLLDVRFREDFCQVRDRNAILALNTIRKIALNSIKKYKSETNSKQPYSVLMFDCLLDCRAILNIVDR